MERIETSITVNLPGPLLRVLDDYCTENQLTRSQALIQALESWSPLKERLSQKGRQLILSFASTDQQNRPGKFFVISGPSGVGKNSLLTFALEREKGIYYLPSLTTRAIRPREHQGNPYYFITPEEFEAMIKENVFLEWKKIHTGNYYGTHLPTILYALENGFDIATDMDVLGCSDAIKRFPNNIVSIFIAPPNLEELRNRLIKRDDDPAIISKRLERVEMEMARLPNYHHVITNDNLERAGEELANIFKSYRKEM